MDPVLPPPERAPTVTPERAPFASPERAPVSPSAPSTYDLSNYAPFLADDTLDISTHDLPVIEQHRERMRLDNNGDTDTLQDDTRHSTRRLQQKNGFGMKNTKLMFPSLMNSIVLVLIH